MLPSCSGGLHCGNQVSSGVTASCSSVLPPPNGGLHCGTHRSPRLIALLTGAPAVHRRALLRAVLQGARQRLGLTVLPPSDGGLHCGMKLGLGDWWPALVLPPFDGGLHCGTIFVTSVNVCVGVLPPFSGRLHRGESEDHTEWWNSAPACSRY